MSVRIPWPFLVAIEHIQIVWILRAHFIYWHRIFQYKSAYVNLNNVVENTQNLNLLQSSKVTNCFSFETFEKPMIFNW